MLTCAALSRSERLRSVCLWLRTSLIVELLLLICLAVASTWPLASRIDTAIPKGQEKFATVPLFNLWTIWWNADRTSEGLRNYWDAPIFAPTEGTFALSEAQPTMAIVAPIALTANSRALAYNLYLLTMLVTNGWAGSLLVRNLTDNRLVGLWGGAALLLLPLVHWQLGVLQLTAISGILLSLHFLIRFFNDYHLKDAILAGVSIGFSYLSCNYFGYQLCLTLLFASPVFLLKQCNVKRLAAGLLIIVAVFGSIVSPIVAMQLSMSQEKNWKRNPETISRLSAIQNDYLSTLWRGPLSDRSARKARFPLSPGAACSALAVAGAFIGLLKRNTRRITLFLLLFLIVAAQLSLGPLWTVGGYSPFEILTKWLPGLSAMRSPHRFAILVQISSVLLCGLSFALPIPKRPIDSTIAEEDNPASNDHPAMPKPSGLHRVAHCGLMALCCAVLIENWPHQPALYTMPDYERQRSWIEWLKQETHPDDIVANLPFPTGRKPKDYEDTTVAMLWGTYHQRRLANGYSGFFPAEFVRLKANVQNFPDQKSIDSLLEAGVRWCVVDVEKSGELKTQRLAEQPLLDLKFQTDDGSTQIYEILPPDSDDVEPNWFQFLQ